MKKIHQAGFVTTSLLLSVLMSGGAATYSVVAWGGSAPVPSPNSGFVAVSGGGGHALALLADGKVAAWGGNGDGQCNVPARLKGVAMVEAGNRYSLALGSNGVITAWGYNGYGQTSIPGPNKNFVYIAAGWNHGVGIKSSGSVVCWGWNGVGQLNVPSPNLGFVKVATRTWHNVGLKSDGTVVGWGRNLSGECNPPPPLTFGESRFVDVACGGYYPDPLNGPFDGNLDGWSMALTDAGRVVVWGSDRYGQITNRPTETGFVAIAAGNNHAIALRADGSVVCWGAGMVNSGVYPDYGQSLVPSPNQGFLAIDAMNNVSLALRSYP